MEPIETFFSNVGEWFAAPGWSTSHFLVICVSAVLLFVAFIAISWPFRVRARNRGMAKLQQRIDSLEQDKQNRLLVQEAVERIASGEAGSAARAVVSTAITDSVRATLEEDSSFIAPLAKAAIASQTSGEEAHLLAASLRTKAHEELQRLIISWWSDEDENSALTDIATEIERRALDRMTAELPKEVEDELVRTLQRRAVNVVDGWSENVDTNPELREAIVEVEANALSRLTELSTEDAAALDALLLEKARDAIEVRISDGDGDDAFKDAISSLISRRVELFKLDTPEKLAAIDEALLQGAVNSIKVRISDGDDDFEDAVLELIKTRTTQLGLDPEAISKLTPLLVSAVERTLEVILESPDDYEDEISAFSGILTSLPNKLKDESAYAGQLSAVLAEGLRKVIDLAAESPDDYEEIITALAAVVKSNPSSPQA